MTPVILKDHKINEWLTLVETAMRLTLAKLLAQAVQEIIAFKTTELNSEKYLMWVDKYQAQLVVLAAQISWSEDVEKALQTIEASGGKASTEPVQKVLQVVESTLNVLADSVLHEQPPVRRRKLEHLVSTMTSLICTYKMS